MAGLTGKTISSNYKSLLRVNDDSSGVDTSLENVTDGEGTLSSMSISDDQLKVEPQNDNTTTAFVVNQKGGSGVLQVDSTNKLVKVNGGLDYANTQYAYFSITNLGSTSTLVNTHTAMSFGMFGATDLQQPKFGTGTDPNLLFTTADASTEMSGTLVSCLWYIPDNITIDSVTHFEGADAATGDTTRCHLMSYDFTSGSTSALTNGAVLAYNADIANAGNEQAYKSTWTVSSADVDANKVVLAMWRSDSINSDYSFNVIVKYHLR